MDEIIQYGSPDPLRDVNNAWIRLASQFGLFGKEREFLLGVRADEESDSVWARVRLGEEWNVAGHSPSTITGPCRPWTGGLLTMSLSGSVVIIGTTYEQCMAVLALPDPHRVPVIRRYAQYVMAKGKLSEWEDENLRAWLDQD
ncbi:hypothetical protein ACWFQ8_24390 [Streptomyces sp. NPDC055254]